MKVICFVDARLTAGGITDVAFYVLKYMLKGTPQEASIHSALKLNYATTTEGEETWNLIKSKQRHSHNFGLDIWDENDHDYTIINYLREGIERSKKTSLYPLYYCPEQLMTFPLAPYYKRNPIIYDIKDALDFYYKDDHTGQSIDTRSYKERELTQTLKAFTDYERKLKIVDQDVFSETLEELYNT